MLDRLKSLPASLRAKLPPITGPQFVAVCAVFWFSAIAAFALAWAFAFFNRRKASLTDGPRRVARAADAHTRAAAPTISPETAHG